MRQHVRDKKAGRVFEARNGSPISGNNVLKRVLHPLLKRLGIPKAGLHTFRHLVTVGCGLDRIVAFRKAGFVLRIGHTRTSDEHWEDGAEHREDSAPRDFANCILYINGVSLLPLSFKVALTSVSMTPVRI